MNEALPERLIALAAGSAVHGDLAAAEGAAEAAIALRPDSHAAWATLAITLAKMNKHERAVSAFERAIALDPKDLASLTSLGELLIELGSYKRAGTYLDRACALDPKAEQPMGRRARALIAKTLSALKQK
jgi:tetratricopeptide (TPR) repeat protein